MLTSEAIFQPPARTSRFEQPKYFRAAQNTTCRVLVNTKIRPSGRIEIKREQRLNAVAINPYFQRKHFHDQMI